VTKKKHNNPMTHTKKTPNKSNLKRQKCNCLAEVSSVLIQFDSITM